jgi:hypothetical protein
MNCACMLRASLVAFERSASSIAAQRTRYLRMQFFCAVCEFVSDLYVTQT